jgi:hypothetical protein
VPTDAPFRHVIVRRGMSFADPSGKSSMLSAKGYPFFTDDGEGTLFLLDPWLGGRYLRDAYP